MNKGFVAFLAFSCGGVIGFITGKKMLEQHYNQVVQEEIDSVKQAFRRQMQAVTSKEKEQQSDEKTGKPAERKLNDSTIRAMKKDYRKYYPESKPAPESENEEPEEEDVSKPHVITPAEFDTITGYEAISLTYYADGTVADDDDNPMSDEDIEETIGRESLNHFGEYERDSVFVRNDDMRTDYEILLDSRRYEDAIESKPYKNPTH